MIPVYIIQSYDTTCESSCIEYVTADKDKAFEYFDNIQEEDDYIIYSLEEWLEDEYEVLKSK